MSRLEPLSPWRRKDDVWVREGSRYVAVLESVVAPDHRARPERAWQLTVYQTGLLNAITLLRKGDGWHIHDILADLAGSLRLADAILEDLGFPLVRGPDLP